MSKSIIICLLFFFLWTPKNRSRKYVITHYNITFAPDLSNRVKPNLYKRPLNDIDLLKVITSNLYPSIIRSKRSQNQQDKLLIDFINKGLITLYDVRTDNLFIDIGKFPNQIKRIQYLTNSPVAKPTFRQDVEKMNTEFSRVYRNAVKDNSGADIWTYLDQGISNRHVLEDEALSNIDGIPCINQYRNILILPTDGYIEAGVSGNGFDLSQQTVNRFRKAFLASGEGNIESFFKKNKSFHLKPVQNAYLKKMEILVLELYDRSLTKSGSATIHPTDMEIIKLFWSDWLKESKVGRYELRPFANSKQEVEKIILDFLNVEKKTDI